MCLTPRRPRAPSVSTAILNIKLLEQDGYCIARRSKHGVRLYKKLPDRTIVTVIPTKSAPLPESTLGDILSLERTGLGKSGLRRLIEEYGLP